MVIDSYDDSIPGRMTPKFSPGQLVRHTRYHYRGVVAARDPECRADEFWYKKNKTQPPRNQPWYHVLVDGSSTVTYPAESSLEADTTGTPIEHPLLTVFFGAFLQGRYQRNDTPWPEDS